MQNMSKIQCNENNSNILTHSQKNQMLHIFYSVAACLKFLAAKNCLQKEGNESILRRPYISYDLLTHLSLSFMIR